jgi:MarR family transcriptional regulator for hemolysin
LSRRESKLNISKLTNCRRPPIPPKAHPARSVGFLITDVSHLLRRNFNRRAQALGLSQAQWRALAHLARDEGLNQSALAERLEIQPITLTRLIDRMEAAGWVERRPDPTDRRAVRLFLTAQAQPVLAEMQRAAAGMLDEALRGLSVDARQNLVDTLCKIKRNLSDVESQAAPGFDSGKKRHVRRDRERSAR